jgi:hypothetical protein
MVTASKKTDINQAPKSLHKGEILSLLSTIQKVSEGGKSRTKRLEVLKKSVKHLKRRERIN